MIRAVGCGFQARAIRDDDLLSRHSDKKPRVVIDKSQAFNAAKK
jgi:hypothetical protein